MIKLARERGVRVSDVMTSDVFAITAGTKLADAAQMLSERRVSGAPVLAGDGRPIGIVTRADLLDPRHNVLGATVEDAMTRVLYAVRTTDPAMAAVRLMVAEGIHRAVVVDREGNLVGIVTAMDILRALAHGEPDQDVAIEFVPLGA